MLKLGSKNKISPYPPRQESKFLLSVSMNSKHTIRMVGEVLFTLTSPAARAAPINGPTGDIVTSARAGGSVAPALSLSVRFISVEASLVEAFARQARLEMTASGASFGSVSVSKVFKGNGSFNDKEVSVLSALWAFVVSADKAGIRVLR